MIFRKKKEIDFDVHSICEGHHKVTYRGVKAIRSPFDYVLYQMIINEIKPDLIIEIGTNIGGGALYMADMLEIIGNGIIHTIDLFDQSEEIVKQHPRINCFFGGWEAYDTKIAEKYEKILIIEDASHMYEDTLAVLHKFNYLVTKDSYLIVEDGIVDELGITKEYNGGPLKAIKEFLEINKNFIIDRKWCDFFGKNATFNVNGFLKKIK